MRQHYLWLPLIFAAGCAAEKANGRPWIHKVEIGGVKHVSQKDLKSKISLESTSWIPLSPKHYLDPFAVDMDKKRIEAYYAAHGYFFAKVTEAKVVERNTKKPSVDVQLVVDEGPPTKIDKLETEGLDAVGGDAQRIQKRLKQVFQAGTVFDHGKYLEEKSNVENHLKNLGFAWANVNGEVDVNRDTRTADVTLKIDPGPVAKFGTVSVRGNLKGVREQLIIDRAMIPSGQKFSPDELEVARGRVYNTGVYSSVKVEYEHDVVHPEVANVIITVYPGKEHELRLGAGVGFESTRYDLHLAGTYVKHSFLGGLRTLKIRLEPGWVFLVLPSGSTATGGPTNGPSVKSDVTFTQPDFLWRDLELKWLVGYDVGIDYAYQYHGPRTTVGVTHPFWTNRVVLGLSYNFQFLMFFNTIPEFQNNPGQATTLFGYTNPYRVGWWQEDAHLDLRDKPLDPKKGIYVGTSVEEGGPYAAGTFTYEKVMPELRLYAPLGTKRVVIATRGMFGQMFDQGEDGSPITRRFYMGGPNSHRGFNYERLSPQVPPCPPLSNGMKNPAPACQGTATILNIPIGGDQMVLFNAELRFDIVKIAGNWFGATTFLDAGDVAAPTTSAAQTANLKNILQGVCGTTPVKISSSVDMRDLNYAVGGGLRYHTPIGTIQADVGVRLNRLSQCEPDGTPNPDPGQRIAFHISIGESF
jgi:translocation and assembly module TamA